MIVEGTHHPFTGPIYDTEGTLRLEKDEIITTEDILEMDWYVDNVEVEEYQMREFGERRTENGERKN